MREREIQSLLARLESFREIPEGWLEDDGFYGNDRSKAPSARAIVVCSQMLEALLTSCPEIQKPFTYPMVNGGIQVEWEHPCLSVETYFEDEDEDKRVKVHVSITNVSVRGDSGEDGNLAPIYVYLESLVDVVRGVEVLRSQLLPLLAKKGCEAQKAVG